MENKENIQVSLSIADTIQKYSYDCDEVVSTTKDFVRWGKDNKYPTFLKNLKKNSATLKSIIDGTVNYICGNDIIISDDIASFKNSINRKGETFNDLVNQVAEDYMLYKGFAIQVIYNKLRAVAELYALDFSKCRVDENREKVYYNKKSWGTYSSQYKIYPAFGHGKEDEYSEVFYFTDGARTIYPHPKFEGSINDVLTEIECSKYTLNSISNGLSTRYIISIPNSDNLPQEQKDALNKQIRDKFTGTDNPSPFMLYFAKGNLETQGLKVDSIATDKQNEEFITIKKSARENIFIAFSATPMLFGLPQDNHGFSKLEYMESFELYNKTQVLPIQKKIVRAIDIIFQKSNCISIKPFALDVE